MHHRRVLYTVEEAADLLGVSPSTMYRWARAGDLRTVPLGGRLAVPASSLERFFTTPTDGETEVACPKKDLNQVAITGRVVADPEQRESRAGLRYATFKVAVNRRRPTSESFHVVVVAFGVLAEDTANLHAGDLVRVDGRLGQREWTAEDGTRIGAQRVIAERVRTIETAPAQEVAS